MRQELSLKQNQKLVLTMAMRKALHVLSLPLMELGPWLMQQIEANPMLELEEELAPKSPFNGDVPELPSLYHHLMNQVPLHFSAPEEREIAEWIIGNLDGEGFFQRSEDLSPFFLSVLEKLQMLDPPGVAALDLRESLLIQLKVCGKEHSLSFTLVKDHFQAVLRNRLLAVEKSLGRSISEIRKVIRVEIAALNFHLTSSFSLPRARPIKPDLFIQETGDGWHIEVLNDLLPQFHFVRAYLELLESGEISKEERAFIRSHISAGKWLFRALNNREKFLFQVGKYLTEMQPQCFKGEVAKPLMLQQAADNFEVHLSTVTRAVQDKYCLCEAGILPLKSFFARPLSQGASVEEAKALLKKLVASENTRAPYSDQALCEEVSSHGIPISRRTIAKYRHLLAIPPARQRRNPAE